ncbi:MAG: hypothetical protein ACPGSD_07645 [Flavobacteriales bacterium]
MNYLQTQLGGFDLYLDDIEFIEESVLSVLRGHVSHLAVHQPTFVLSGCEITVTGSDTINISDGWVVVAGDLVKCEAHSIEVSDQEQEVRFSLETTDIVSPESQKTKDDGTTYYAHQKRHAVLKLDLSGNTALDSCYYSLDGGNKHWFTYRDVMVGKEKNIQMLGNWAFSGDRRPYYQKDFFGRVHVGGKTPSIASSSDPYSLSIGILPAGFRPENDLFGLFSSETGQRAVKITALTGEITILGSSFVTTNGELIFPKFKGM